MVSDLRHEGEEREALKMRRDGGMMDGGVAITLSLELVLPFVKNMSAPVGLPEPGGGASATRRRGSK